MTDQQPDTMVASEDIEHGASGAPPAHFPQATPQQQQQNVAHGSHAAHLRYGQPPSAPARPGPHGFYGQQASPAPTLDWGIATAASGHPQTNPAWHARTAASQQNWWAPGAASPIQQNNVDTQAFAMYCQQQQERDYRMQTQLAALEERFQRHSIQQEARHEETLQRLERMNARWAHAIDSFRKEGSGGERDAPKRGTPGRGSIGSSRRGADDDGAGSTASDDAPLSAYLDKHGEVKGGFPTSTELEGVQTDLDPSGNLRDWFDEFQSKFGKRYKGLKRFLRATDDQLEEMWQENQEEPGYGEHDDLLHRLLSASLKGGKHVRLLKSTLAAKRREAAKDGDEDERERYGTGWYLMITIKQSFTSKRSETQRRNQQDFGTKQYFEPRMTEVDVQNKCNDLRNDYESLPLWAQSGRNGLLHSAIYKMPDFAKENRQRLASELDASEINGKPAPWTFDVLAEHIGAAVAQEEAAGARKDKENDMRIGAGYVGKGPTCANCKGAHSVKECTVRPCPKSKFRFCACVRGEACWFAKADAMPAEPKDAFGRKLPDFINDKIEKKRVELFPEMKVASAQREDTDEEEEVEVRVG